MSLKLIIVAIVSLVISVTVFKKSSSMATIVGFCGVFTMLLLAVNEIIAKIN